MITTNLFNQPLATFIGKESRNQRCVATFPITGALGSRNLAAVYFELEPGDHLGRHTDSAEELLVILEGKVEVELSGNRVEGTSGSIFLVPEREPHNITNTGADKVKVLGVFGGANNIVASFEKEWLPGGRVVDTKQI